MKKTDFIKLFGNQIANSTDENEIENLAKMISKAIGGQIAEDETPEPTAQQQCYINHPGQCGDCSVSGGWTGC